MVSHFKACPASFTLEKRLGGCKARNSYDEPSRLCGRLALHWGSEETVSITSRLGGKGFCVSGWACEWILQGVRHCLQDCSLQGHTTVDIMMATLLLSPRQGSLMHVPLKHVLTHWLFLCFTVKQAEVFFVHRRRKADPFRPPYALELGAPGRLCLHSRVAFWLVLHKLCQ